jgi:rubrerythrin
MWKNSDEKRAYNREWMAKDRIKNPEKYRQRDRVRYRGPVRGEWIEKNKEKLREHGRVSDTKRADRKKAWSRIYRKRNEERIRAYSKLYAEKHRHKLRARWRVKQAIRDGRLRRLPCEVCGSLSEAHHADYSKPLDVRWLCRKHHGEIHRITYPVSAKP